jgi:hypothetical protein
LPKEDKVLKVKYNYLIYDTRNNCVVKRQVYLCGPEHINWNAFDNSMTGHMADARADKLWLKKIKELRPKFRQLAIVPLASVVDCAAHSLQMRNFIRDLSKRYPH